MLRFSSKAVGLIYKHEFAKLSLVKTKMCDYLVKTVKTFQTV